MSVRPPGGAFTKAVTLALGPGAEAQALALLEEVRQAFGIAQEALADFRLAVLEACLNALEHGAPPVEVEVEGERVGAGLRLWVHVVDHGQGFSPQGIPRPHLPAKLGSPRKRGWGLEIMRRFADDLQVESQPGYTKVSLMRWLKEA